MALFISVFLYFLFGLLIASNGNNTEVKEVETKEEAEVKEIETKEETETTEENRECGQPQRWSAALSFPYIFLR